MKPRSPKYNRSPFPLLALIFVGVGGCKEEPAVRHYKEERVVQTKIDKPEAAKEAIPVREPDSKAVPTRYLNAIIPTGDNRSYFIKLNGDPTELDKVEPSFQKFITSLKFPKAAGQELKWEAPSDWSVGPENQMRIATLRVPVGEGKADLTITQFGGDTKANIDRWRKELGLEALGAIGDDEYKKTVKEIAIDGKTVYVIDMRGTKKPGSGMMPPFMNK